MISFEQFLLRQPGYPEVTGTDRYYFDLCNQLVEIAKEKKLFRSYPEKVVERAALCLVGYYQDVSCDAGIWRSFITENRRLYGWTVPFNPIGENYIDFELNREDVRFMVWYALSMNYEDLRICYPLDLEIVEGADQWFEELQRVYDDSPLPEDYRLVHELEMNAPEDREAIFKLGHWLFMHCYLMLPAFALTLGEMGADFDLNTEEGLIGFRKRLDEAMSDTPTGPLALFLREWLFLIIEGRMPKEPAQEERGDHKYYGPFIEATGGSKVKFFDKYEDMNRFFIEVLGWAKDEEHLSHVKDSEDFVLMVDRRRGLLMALNVAKCIAAPENPYYDKEYAAKNAIKMLTVRGFCPADLTKYAWREGWLPDAVFPGTEDHALVKEHHDFIMRCYLQGYYRD